MFARMKEYLVKLIPVPAGLAARIGLLACVLAAASLHGFTPAAAASPGTAATTTTARSGLAPSAAAAAQAMAASSFATAINANFRGLREVDGGVPDPNAAASPTQIVEVVNGRLQAYTRDGDAPCAAVDLNTLFGTVAGEELTDPRVIYDPVNGKFVVMIAVISVPPAPGVPHLPLIQVLDLAYNATSDACGTWVTRSVDVSDSDVPEGSFVDQPTMGQDHDALLFGGANFTNDESSLVSYVAFSYSKSCLYAFSCTDIPKVFHPAHYATPASSGGSPMITTAHSYFVAAVPSTGYELYRMDNSANVSATTFALQASIASAQATAPPTRDGGQPGTPNLIDLAVGNANAVRITSPPTFDGTRIWFTHESTSGTTNPHPSVRYGAINTATNTVATAVAYHGPGSDDFNPSIAVGINGASRTIFLNWAWSDVKGGMPVSATVAAVTIGSTDPPPPVIGKDIRLIPGGITGAGITGESRFGDYSSVAVDPASQACAVTAQEYFESATNGKWATRISLFGPSGCGSGQQPLTATGGASATTLSLPASSLALDEEGGTQLSFTVTPATAPGPTGTVTITAGGTVICQGTLTSGTGSCAIPDMALSPGSYQLTATYSGDGTFAASTSEPQSLTITTGTGPQGGPPAGGLST
jgi:Bacterial Ig-like domain (group 3)